MVGERRKARTLALMVLYEADAVKHDAVSIYNRMLAELEPPLSPENDGFAHKLVDGVLQNREKLDDYIRSYAPAWPVEQLPIVDRNILRLAIYEILLDDKVPVKVVINEAVEIAKHFSNDSAAKFINGVLGSVSDIANR